MDGLRKINFFNDFWAKFLITGMVKSFSASKLKLAEKGGIRLREMCDLDGQT